MRILVVSNLYPPDARGGYEVECMGVVDHLRERHDVEVLTSSRGAPAPGEAGIHRLLPFLPEGIAPSLLAPLHALRAVTITRRLLAGFRPQLVLVFNGASIPQATLLEIARSELPIAVRVCEHWFGGLYVNDRFLRHLVPGETGLRGIWARAMRAINRAHPGLRFDLDLRTPWAVSWNSEFIRGAVAVPASVEIVYESLYVPANPRVPRFASVVRRPAEGEPVIFFAGRLDAYKGPEVAVRAVAALRDRHGIAARLVLAGDGSSRERDDLNGLAAELHVGDRVELVGRLEFEQMADYLSTCAAWVVPSVWDEPAPTVALEAALARVPAVLSRVGGTAEMLREDEEALFFARSDHDGCADALAATISDPIATQRRIERAHTRALELDWDGYLRSTDDFVEGAARALGVTGSLTAPGAAR